MSTVSTGLSDYEKSNSTADLGAFTIQEFCDLFRISRRTAYNEAAAGALEDHEST
jgi:hypothetical protein